MNYKLAEHFDSIQGEASYAGQHQYFIRLAGCNVGKYTKAESSDFRVYEKLNELRVLNPKHSLCTSALSNEFLCDTNYFSTETFSETELISKVVKAKAKVICITGGEPFLWNLSPLVMAAWDADIRVHVETSGTLPFTQDVDWIVCSPKLGFLEENLYYVNEWKFVIGKDLNISPQEVVDRIKAIIKDSKVKVYLSPINGINTIDKVNSDFAFEVVKLGEDNWRMCTQSHKVFGMR
jgi:7-carboxy-7-deazaguanine synthase